MKTGSDSAFSLRHFQIGYVRLKSEGLVAGIRLPDANSVKYCRNFVKVHRHEKRAMAK